MKRRGLLVLVSLLLLVLTASAKVVKKVNRNISMDPKYPIELLGKMISYNGKYIQLDNRHILVCPTINDTLADNHIIFKHLKDALETVPEDLANEGDVYVYLTPGVHWVDKRTPNEKRIVDMQMHNGCPTSVSYSGKNLHLVGLNPDPENVVIAGNRGNMRGAVGDYAIMYLHCEGFYMENITMGNYCNVDLRFPLNHDLDYDKISTQLTQAQLARSFIRCMYAQNCRFIGYESATPPMGYRTLFHKCFFEVGDMPLPLDAVFLDCDLTWHSNNIFKTMAHAIFLNSKIYTESASIWQFYENPQAHITLVDCEVHEDDIDRNNMEERVNTMAKYARCNFSNVYYNGDKLSVKNAGGMFVSDGDVSDQQNVLDGYYTMIEGRKVYNTYDLLRGQDDWDPMGVKSFFTDQSSKTIKPFRFAGALEIRDEQLFKGRRIFETDKVDDDQTITLTADYLHIGSANGEKISKQINWTLDPACASFASIVSSNEDHCEIKLENKTYKEQTISIKAEDPDGIEALCTFNVGADQLEAPSLASKPQISQSGDKLEISYKLRNAGDADNSVVRWIRCKDPKSGGICVLTSHDEKAVKTYNLTPADNGYYIKVKVTPRCKNSKQGKPMSTMTKKPIEFDASKETVHTLQTNFEEMPTSLQAKPIPGFWMNDIYVPRDSAQFSWLTTAHKNAWRYEKGIDHAENYKGFNQQTRGARLVYIPDTVNTYSPDMNVTFMLTPAKGQGQGVASSGEYIDFFVQYDPVTSTGFGLRLQRWAEYNRAVTFTLMKYRNGFATPISRSALSNCFVGDCYVTIKVKDRTMAVSVNSTYPVEMRSRIDDVDSEVLLTTKINPLPFRAFGIHTLASPTWPILLRDIKCTWGTDEE